MKTFEDINKINPTLGQQHLDYIINIANKKKQMFLPSWMDTILLEKDSKFCGKFLGGKMLAVILKRGDIDPQIYYDTVILGLITPDLRPKCPICGNNVPYISLMHGYQATCSKKCHSDLKKQQIIHNTGMTHKGETVSDAVKKKISQTLKGRLLPEEERVARSIRMKEYVKTEKGHEFLKNMQNKATESNKRILLGEKTVSTATGYYVNGRFKRGIVHLTTFNKDLTFDSGWEQEFIKYFDNLENIKNIDTFDKCRELVPYIDVNGKERKYLPDFFVRFKSGSSVVIEIKPERLLKTDETVKLKVSAGTEFFKNKNINYIVLTENELIAYRRGKPVIKSDFDINRFDKPLI